jgi:hypothetical protein
MNKRFFIKFKDPLVRGYYSEKCWSRDYIIGIYHDLENVMNNDRNDHKDLGCIYLIPFIGLIGINHFYISFDCPILAKLIK